MAKNFAPTTPVQINLIATGTELEGTLNAKDDTRICGKLKGTLRVEGKAIISQEGSIEGEIFATDADVAGTVKGEITIKGRLVLKGTAKIEGTIRASRLIVEEGATIDGSCQMGQLDKSRADALRSGTASQIPKQPGMPAPKSQSSFPVVSGD